jgi:hypothetical protein
MSPMLVSAKIAAPKIARTDNVLAGWASVQIDAAEPPTAGFKINGTELVGSSDLDFGGWLGKHVVLYSTLSPLT